MSVDATSTLLDLVVDNYLRLIRVNYIGCNFSCEAAPPFRKFNPEEIEEIKQFLDSDNSLHRLLNGTMSAKECADKIVPIFWETKFEQIRSKRNGKVLKNSNVVILKSDLNDAGRFNVNVLRFLMEDMEMGTNEALMFIYYEVENYVPVKSSTFSVYRSQWLSYHRILNNIPEALMKTALKKKFKIMFDGKREKLAELLK